MDKTVPAGAALLAVDFDVAMEVASNEALIRQTYRDSVGVLTWCVGMTNATGHTVERYIGRPQTVQNCMNVYAWALDNYAAGVRRAFAGHAISKAQFAAALSFHWNTGAIEKALWVELWKKGQIAEAKKAFMHWVTPPQIEGRRAKERDLFFDGKWSNDGTMTEYTQLTSKMTPVWSSARKIDVSQELRAAFTSSAPITLDVPMQPDAPVQIPTLTPSASPSPKPGGAGAIVVIVILAAAIGAAFFLFNR